MAERVLVLAEDLIWRDRLGRSARAAGLEPVAVSTVAALEAALADGGRLVVIDLTARSYDGLGATAAAAAAGARVLAVGQHDDHEGRKAARAAGAEQVLAYRKLFEDGPATIARWAGVPAPAPDAPVGPRP